MSLDISIAPEVLFNILGIPVTNSLLMTWLTMAVLIAVFAVAMRKISEKPRGFYNVIEFVFEFLLDFMDGITGSRWRTITFAPVVLTIFFLFLGANWLSVFPGIGSLGLVRHVAEGETAFVPLLRTATADYNLPLSMALVVSIMIQVYAIKTSGVWGHARKYIWPKPALDDDGISKGMKIALRPLDFFMALLDIIGEIARVLSLSLRLFGNIIAGEVLMVVAMAFVAYVVPSVVIAMGIFFGAIQALIFAVLSLAFFSLSSEEAETGSGPELPEKEKSVNAKEAASLNRISRPKSKTA